MRISAIFVSALLLVLTTGCDFFSGSSNPSKGTNFTTTVFLGDSLTAGFQNGSLLDTQQPHGYANLIAKQANFTLALPLIAAPGVPAVLQLVSQGPPPVTKQASGISTGRDDVTVQATDLAVPGHLLADLLNRLPIPNPTSGEDIITSLVLGLPGLAEGKIHTQLGWAEQLNPTTVFVFIGSNDALLAVNSGKPSSMTPVTTFASEYTQLMQALHTKTTARLIVANVPDVTLVASLTPGSVILSEFSKSTGIPVAQLSATLGIQANDLVNATGLSEVEAIIAGKQPGPVSDSGFLTPAEVTTIQQTVQQYNTTIAQQVGAVGGTLVDLDTAFTKLKTNPPTINGFTPSFAYLGGIFSLDGVHPTNTGYALLANIFVDSINTSLSTKIPDVNVGPIAAADPYFPPNLPKQAARPTSISVTAAHSLDWMMKRPAKR